MRFFAPGAYLLAPAGVGVCGEEDVVGGGEHIGLLHHELQGAAAELQKVVTDILPQNSLNYLPQDYQKKVLPKSLIDKVRDSRQTEKCDKTA